MHQRWGGKYLTRFECLWISLECLLHPWSVSSVQAWSQGSSVGQVHTLVLVGDIYIAVVLTKKKKKWCLYLSNSSWNAYGWNDTSSFKMVGDQGGVREYKWNSILDEVVVKLEFLIHFLLLPICFKSSKIEGIFKRTSFLLTESPPAAS